MIREIDLQEITDGKLYTSSDMVKAGCGDCQGCSECCQGMGESIILDPYDIYQITTNLECSFGELLESCVELQVVDGLVLPNLKMLGEKEQCGFLNAQGRCNIHAFRPGLCRLFPLGRTYEGEEFRYFLQSYECPKEPKTKVKIKKWLDIPQLPMYEDFVKKWHGFRKNAQQIISETDHEVLKRKLTLYILEQFYQKPYDPKKDFYSQFEIRLKLAGKYFGIG